MFGQGLRAGTSLVSEGFQLVPVSYSVRFSLPGKKKESPEFLEQSQPCCGNVLLRGMVVTALCCRPTSDDQVRNHLF